MTTKRQVFYSFHYIPDSWRAAQVRNIGVVDGNRPAPDNDWETITGRGDAAIEAWIREQMHYRSCTVVLVGQNTADRKWINHEIESSWNANMGVVGIRIHGLKNSESQTALAGSNPFDFITLQNGTMKMSQVVKCYDPAGLNSQDRYAWISTHLSNAVEEAIAIRKAN